MRKNNGVITIATFSNNPFSLVSAVLYKDMASCLFPSMQEINWLVPRNEVTTRPDSEGRPEHVRSLIQILIKHLGVALAGAQGFCPFFW